VRVAVCGRYRLVRGALAEALSAEPDMEVVATKRSLDNLVVACDPGSVDVVVVVPGASAPTAAEVNMRFPGTLSVLGEAGWDVAELVRMIRTKRYQPVQPGEPGEDVEDPYGQVLNDREVDILRLVAAGRSAASIGKELGIGTRTVENHRRRLYAKLGVRSPAQAVAAGMQEGVLRPGPTP
jgi:DNA-binding NarL/FixJ family response regulator